MYLLNHCRIVIQPLIPDTWPVAGRENLRRLVALMNINHRKAAIKERYYFEGLDLVLSTQSTRFDHCVFVTHSSQEPHDFVRIIFQHHRSRRPTHPVPILEKDDPKITVSVVVEAPMWKYSIVKMGSSSPIKGGNKKYLSCHHLEKESHLNHPPPWL